MSETIDKATIEARAMLRTLIPPDISVRETLAENERVLARARGETSK